MKKTVKFSCFVLVLCFVFASCASKKAPEAPKPTKTQEEEVVKSSGGSVSTKAYSVGKNDTLSQIAERNYTHPKAYYFPIIMVCSPDAGIVDPDTIEPNTVLNIPNFDEFMADADKKAEALKEFDKTIEFYRGKGLSGMVKILNDAKKSF